MVSSHLSGGSLVREFFFYRVIIIIKYICKAHFRDAANACYVRVRVRVSRVSRVSRVGRVSGLGPPLRRSAIPKVRHSEGSRRNLDCRLV